MAGDACAASFDPPSAPRVVWGSVHRMSSFDPLASTSSPLIVYIDYKSPYAFVSIEPTYQIEDHLGIEIDWRPLTLDIPSYLGSARLDETGRHVVEENRTPAQWEGVRYAYRDARRYAALQGLTL